MLAAIAADAPQMHRSNVSGRHAEHDQAGFTLVELLVVVLVIGILAAIALPNFISQSNKATDAQAKSGAGILYRAVEACETESNDYAKCTTPAQVPDTGLSWGSNSGEVKVTNKPFGLNGVLSAANSGSGNVFAILKTLSDRKTVRVCQIASGHSYPYAGCRAGGPYSAFGFGTW